MRIVYVGSTSLGLAVLDAVNSLEEVQIVGCISAPPTFEISYSQEPVSNVLHEDFRPYCDAAGIPIRLTATGMRDPELHDWASALTPDAFLVVGWYHMIPKSWRALAPAYGVHASLLPDLAGGAPLVWAMILGRQRTGVTLFQMDDGVDTGDIVSQQAFLIHAHDTIADLLKRAEIAAIEMIPRAMTLLASGDLLPVPQTASERVVMPQRSAADGLINWGGTVSDVERFVRAQTRPYPGAFTHIAGKRVTVWRVSPLLHADGQGYVRPASLGFASLTPIFWTDGSRLVACCADGAVEISEAEVDGRMVASSDLLGTRTD